MTVDEIAVPDRPIVPGVRFRRFRGPADYPGIADAEQAARADAGLLDVASVVTIATEYDHLVNCDRDRDIVVVELDGSIAGIARVDWRDLVDGTRDFYTTCTLAPSARRRGIGRAMLGWAETRLADLVAGPAGRTDRPLRWSSFTLAADRGATALLGAHGWTENGREYEMIRRTLTDLPDPPLPDGLEVRPIAPDRASREAVWWAAVDAFRDHRYEPEPAPEDLAAFLSDPRQDPDLWLVASDGDEIAGGVLGLIEPPDRVDPSRPPSVIDGVFTRRQWRRRGLARALIAKTLARLRDRGMPSTYLWVDGLNPQQAMRLYGSLGFEIVSEVISWERSPTTASLSGE